MKTKRNFLTLALLALFAFTSCSKDDDGPSGGSASNNLGTYSGNMLVVDDPQTKLGYVYGTTVGVSTKGNVATITVKGNDGFDREFTGSVISSTTTATSIAISKQTKPVDKITAGTLVILNNSVAFDLGFASDKINTKASPTATTVVEIAGKLKVIGTEFIKNSGTLYDNGGLPL